MRCGPTGAAKRIGWRAAGALLVAVGLLPAATMAEAAPAGERPRIPPLSKFEEQIGFTRAVRAGDHIFVSGITAVMPDGSIPADAGAQADRVFEQIVGYVEQLGGRREDMVRVRMFATDIKDADAISAAFSRALKVARPTGTLVAVAALARPEWKVEIEAEAVVPSR